MDHIKSPSNEQKEYVASVCPEYKSEAELLTNSNIVEGQVSCDGCIHWRGGRCDIFDEVLTSIDQT